MAERQDCRTAPRRYDGAKYRLGEPIRVYECTKCGFTHPTGKMDDNGGYPGSQTMINHLINEHGYEAAPRRPGTAMRVTWKDTVVQNYPSGTQIRLPHGQSVFLDLGDLKRIIADGVDGQWAEWVVKDLRDILRDE